MDYTPHILRQSPPDSAPSIRVALLESLSLSPTQNISYVYTGSENLNISYFHIGSENSKYLVFLIFIPDPKILISRIFIPNP